MESSVIKNPEEVDSSTLQAGLSADDKTLLVAQVIREIQFARRYKQGKIKNWQKNEQMYYGKKTVEVEQQSRSNVDLARMQEHVHTIMSKIDDPLVFKFFKRKASQLMRAAYLNSLRAWDSLIDFWDIKDIVMKKQCIIYGRTAAVYYADSLKGIYKPHLEPIDIYDLLVDPAGGGIDVEQMLFWGRYGVIRTKEELENMLKNETDPYMKESLQALVDGSGNATESTQEQTNKFVRMYGQNTIGKNEIQTDEKYKFWQWFTTFKGQRYVLTIQPTAGRAIKIEKLNDLFESNLWPLLTYAAFMDLTEFWTPSYCDYVREMFMTQNVNINQMNDNAEAINKPMKVVNVGAIENLNELKYRRDGLIKTRGDFDANKAVQILVTPSIDTPIKVFNVLEGILEKSSGVTQGDKGADDPRGKVAIYEGNMEASQGRYGLFNKSYSFMYNRFSLLYQWGVKENLVKSVAIDILGPDGIETKDVKRSDIFRKGDMFRTKVESANAARYVTADKMNAKIDFLNGWLENQVTPASSVLNIQKIFETQAKIAGFTEDEIKDLMNKTDYENEELMAEAAADIESILEGTPLKPNPAANNAYKQRFVDYLNDHGQDMKPQQLTDFIDYVKSLTKIIFANEARQLLKFKTDLINKQAEAMASGAVKPPPAAPGTGGAPAGDLTPAPQQQ